MKRWLTLSLALVACTDSELYIPQELRNRPIDNKLRVEGGFCAENAQDLETYLKVMFIIDRSNSMNVTDPNNQRVSAVRDVVMRYVEDLQTFELKAGVEFAVMSFFGDTVVHTRDARGLPGFSRDGAQILFSLTQISRTGANTGYDKALSQAFLIMDSDMARLADSARGRSKYEVIFLSDGMPFPDNCRGEANSPTAAIAASRRLTALSALHKVPVTVHTAFASDPRMFTPGNDVDDCEDSDGYESLYNDSLGQETRALLMAMAEEGGGTFRQFQNGDAISFVDFELGEARRLYAMSSFVAANINALPAGNASDTDSDGDGLSDNEELLIGTRPTLRDSDDDGFNDALEWRLRESGLDPLDPSDGQCPEQSRIDTDGDTLLDCEEIFLGTSRRNIDTDSDGLPDNLEIFLGSDARSAGPLQDLQNDADADGGTNADEVRWHTDPKVDDVAERSKIAYDYAQTERPLVNGRACYDFSVGNVTLTSTEAALDYEEVEPVFERQGYNRVLMYFGQTPYDAPLSEPLYRMACVEARFVEERDLKLPAGGRFTIPRTRVSDTYAATDVMAPESAMCNASVNQDCGLGTLWCRQESDGACNCYRPPREPTDPADGTLVGACPACIDGIDNDNDGKTDFPHDPDCFDTLDGDEADNTACKDGVDNDDDDLVDWPQDPGCDSAYDTSEGNPGTAPECSDGVDNDDDGNVDFPNDPGCFAASDPVESSSVLFPEYACSDGFDNDGDGLIDLEDEGCFDDLDIDEDGPQACFYCQAFTENLPGQCDLGAGYCKPLSADACETRADCRGAPCVDGVCDTCLLDSDCDSAPGALDGICDPRKGWCLSSRYAPETCTSDNDCAGVCETEVGLCDVDPYLACASDRDCRPGDLCSRERGFCLTPVFDTAQCNSDTPCDSGTCDLELGFCVPTEESLQCQHNDLCPLGDCVDGHCDQQTFVLPENFEPEVDCLRAR